MSAYASIFTPGVSEGLIDRINKLTPTTPAGWGKMNVAQMLAHLNVAYDLETGAIPTNNNMIMRWVLKKFVKPSVVGDKPYPKNGRTAPVFIISDERDFEKEKAKLIAHVERVQRAGASAYEGKANPSFGPMTAQEWSTLYHKHMDHHLTQFGV